MKIYISVGLEGVAGIVDHSQGSVGAVDYRMGRELMTKEAAAAAQSALDWGASEVIVSDADQRNGYRSILIEELPEEAWLICGDERPMRAMEGLDETFDAVMLIGYHARHGNQGVLDGTLNTRAVRDISINGQSVGHIGLNAALAGHYEVPILLVSGDDVATEEARGLLPNTSVLCVKKSVGRHAAWSIHPKKAREQIRNCVCEALTKLSQPEQDQSIWTPSMPSDVTITFKYTSMAHRASTIPGMSRIDGTSAGFEAPDYIYAYKMIHLCVEHASEAVTAGKLI